MCPDHGSPIRSARFISKTRGDGSSCSTTATPARLRPSVSGRTSPSDNRWASELSNFEVGNADTGHSERSRLSRQPTQKSGRRGPATPARPAREEDTRGGHDTRTRQEDDSACWPEYDV